MSPTIYFDSHSDCIACPLHSFARHPGICTQVCTQNTGTKDLAVLVVGEAPSREDDIYNRLFTGAPGDALSRIYIGAIKLADHADIYITTACRCAPPPPNTPTNSQIRRCYPHFLADLRQLQSHYQNVIIFCVGAVATRLVLRTSLTASFSRQGRPHVFGGVDGVRECRVFTSYHPSVLLSRRDPSRMVAIKDHLRLLHDAAAGITPVRPDQPATRICPPLPLYPVTRLSLDIESYGAIATQPPQTCFHPAKCMHFDKPKRLIATVALAWRTPEGGVDSAAFLWKNKEHRARLLEFIRNARELVGMNIRFDVLFLRTDPLFAHYLRFGSAQLLDLSVLSYLHSEMRPERSLKAIAPLLGITEYDESHSLKHFRYPTDDDAELLAYNVKDAWATLLAVEKFEARIAADFPKSDKLSPFSRSWYSQLLWTIILMEECGVAFNLDQLDALDFSLVLKMALLYSDCRHRHNILLSGKGSAKPLLDLYTRAVEQCNLVGSPLIALTEKQKLISTNKANAGVLLQYLPEGSELSTIIRKQQQYEAMAKLVESYTRPILHGSPKKPYACRTVPNPLRQHQRPGVGIAYPSWFAVPSQFDSGQEGGTIQGRITGKGPALQTMPKELKNCLTSRYLPGFLMGVDLSQIEMRIAALLSGDRLMLEEYHNRVDRHTMTALHIVREIVAWVESQSQEQILLAGVPYARAELAGFLSAAKPKADPRFNLLRQIGKTTNFLTIYGGSANRLQGTLATDLGISLPLEVCAMIVQANRRKYVELAEYQERLLWTAQREHRIELPLTGQSRSFLGNARAVEDTYRKEIINFPIQTTAANVTLDLQAKVVRALARRWDRTYLGLNIYDAIYLDGPLVELHPVSRLVAECFKSSDYLDRLSDLLARTVPLEYDVEVLVQDSPPLC